MLCRCPVCDKQYTGSYGLKLHMESHAAEKLKTFECYNCKKRFLRKSGLIQHLKTTHVAEENKIAKCMDCGKA